MLTFAEVADASGRECNALVLKDWEEFAVGAGIAGCVGHAATSYSVLGIKVNEELPGLGNPLTCQCDCFRWRRTEGCRGIWNRWSNRRRQNLARESY